MKLVRKKIAKFPTSNLQHALGAGHGTRGANECLTQRESKRFKGRFGAVVIIGASDHIDVQ